MSEAFDHEAYEARLADEELEALIFSAREFVVPSEDLRARVIERAVQENQVRRFASRVGSLTLAVCLLWGCLMPFAHSLGSLRQEWTAPSVEEVERMAYREPATGNQIDAQDWTLVEVFSRMRSLKLTETH